MTWIGHLVRIKSDKTADTTNKALPEKIDQTRKFSLFKQLQKHSGLDFF